MPVQVEHMIHGSGLHTRNERGFLLFYHEAEGFMACKGVSEAKTIFSTCSRAKQLLPVTASRSGHGVVVTWIMGDSMWSGWDSKHTLMS